MENNKTNQNENLSNAKKFINAYNQIDHSLRAQYNFKRGQSFGDMIRRCTSINSIIRKFEDTLIDYSRLRNAIIHGGNDDFIIAEPHDDVVEKMEKIAELVCTPPLIINTVCRKDIMFAQSDDTVQDVLKMIYDSGFSNIPVYQNSSLVGMVNGQRLVNLLGKQVYSNKSIDDYVKNTKIIDALNETEDKAKYYELVSADTTIDQALNLFYSQRKLLALLVTKTGNFNEPALGIVTVGDIIDLNAIMDNYK